MPKRTALSALILFLIVIVAAIIIFFARGYRVNLEGKDLKSTGLLVATSYPDGASVFIDGKLKTATNNTINLNPGNYTVKITKEGYIPWEKKLSVQGEIVTKTEAELFPSTPELRPLTSSGVLDPKLSSDGSKISYFVKNEENPTPLSKDGIWILNISERTLPFNPQVFQITRNTQNIDWSKSKLFWSPDSKEIISIFYVLDSKNTNTDVISQAFLLSTDQLNQIPQDITATINITLTSWEEEKALKDKRLIASLPDGLQDIASSSAKNISLSPDENKIMYTATNNITIPQIITPALLGTDTQEETRNIKIGNTYIYDIKEDKNFLVFTMPPVSPSPKPLKQTPTPTPKTKILEPSPTPTINEKLNKVTSEKPQGYWLATSRHVVFIENSTVYVMEYDGANRQALYGGPFEDSYLFPHLSGSKLIILTNYNKSLGSTPNLYAINLK